MTGVFKKLITSNIVYLHLKLLKKYGWDLKMLTADSSKLKNLVIFTYVYDPVDLEAQTWRQG